MEQRKFLYRLKIYLLAVIFVDLGVMEEILQQLGSTGIKQVLFLVDSTILMRVLRVYQKSKDAVDEGAHDVKMIGWGVENNTPYWLLVNSWNDEWGDNGYFKILRGENHCGIESNIVAGLPKLEN
ncbi:hypothetical protein NQ314_017545 [Rhamnusium bicolor]|uniref:Peptidase C1A papain C-terminal domain-containing protein n=1 Tax=Rhamnusium bicolor TaxID=1586634 RepID=A0AAV8WTX1_9CUCU|nr:hypothetical protein NQ314_017545 [Rhamnusium bicolor]